MVKRSELKTLTSFCIIKSNNVAMPEFDEHIKSVLLLVLKTDFFSPD